MKVSFVVPTKNSARTIANCLSSLQRQLGDVEIIVVDNNSSDGTAEIARRYADVVEIAGPERSAQRNIGARLATGDVVMFVDSDMTLEPNVASEISRTFDDESQLGALIVPERSFGEGFWSSCRVLEKSLYVGDDAVEAPRAFRQDVWAELGGWDETLTAAEDWDLADRTRALGVAIGRVDAWIWHDEGTLRLRGTFGKKRYYGRWIAQYLSTHKSEGGRKLARTSLFNKPGVLARHPLQTSGMLLLKSVEAAGLAAGALDARRESKRSELVGIAA